MYRRRQFMYARRGELPLNHGNQIQSRIIPAAPYYQSRPNYYIAAPVSPTNNDEVEAAAALISLPGKNGGSPTFRPIDEARNIPTQANMSTNGSSKTSSFYPPPLPLETVSSMLHPPPPIKRFVAPRQSLLADTSSISSNEDNLQCLPTNSQQWYTGSTSLALPQDENVLSPLHCFLRKYCVEAFSATEQDVATPRYGKSHGGKIVLHQVGIRCLHCKSMEPKPERAVCYPSSLKNIYHSIETWQRRHAPHCSAIPLWIQRELERLFETSRSTAGGRRQYWQDAAQQVGLVDTPHGVRFARPPGLPVESPCSSSLLTNTTTTTSLQDSSSFLPSMPLVTDQDQELVTDFLFVLMQQMETCAFQEEDRTGGRSKIKDYPVGFGGMQCKHCRGMAGFGRYFPSSINALALANSDRNVYNHLRKCRKCPESTRQELQRLQNSANVKNKRGSRKQFFTKIWNRIHQEEQSV